MIQPSVLDYLKLRVLSHYHEALMLKERKMSAPRMAIVYPTYLCNHRCYGCDYIELNKTRKIYTEQEFLRVIDQLNILGVKAVEFCGGGEPTLNPHLPKAINRIVSLDMFFGFLTNGTNLNADLRDKLVNYGAYCRVSTESGSEEVFNKVKRPINKQAGFNNVIKNVAELVQSRDNSNPKSNLQISLKYAIDIHNYEDVAKAIYLGEKLKIDSVQFKMIRNMPSEIKDEALVEAIIDTINDAPEKSNVRVLFDLSKSELKTKCWLSPLQLTVDPFGDVYICCYYRHRADKHRLGNLFKDELTDIWYSQNHWDKIDDIDISDCNKYDCRFHYYNNLMWDLVYKDIGQLQFI